MYRCRACQIDLDVKTGCPICKDFRKAFHKFEPNLAIEVDDEAELKKANRQSVRILKDLMTKLEKEMRGDIPCCPKCKKKMSYREAKFSPHFADNMTKLSRALKDASTEGRAISREARTKAENLSQEERITLTVSFFKNLPQEKRRDMYNAIAAIHRGLIKAVK